MKQFEKFRDPADRLRFGSFIVVSICLRLELPPTPLKLLMSLVSSSIAAYDDNQPIVLGLHIICPEFNQPFPASALIVRQISAAHWLDMKMERVEDNLSLSAAKVRLVFGRVNNLVVMKSLVLAKFERQRILINLIAYSKLAN